MSPRKQKAKSDRPRGRTEKQAHRVIHEIWRQHPDPGYQRRDIRLRLAAALGVATLLVGVYVGDRLGLAWLMVASAVLGIGMFGGALWQASRSYKVEYQRFVLAHLADDGTFLFCPECQYRLGGSDDAEAMRQPPRRCPECGAVPWRLEKPAEG